MSGFGFRFPGFGFQISRFGFRIPGSGLRISGFGFRIESFRFRGWGLGDRVNGVCQHSSVSTAGLMTCADGLATLGTGLGVCAGIGAIQAHTEARS